MKEKRLFRWVGSAFLVVVLVSLSLMAACAVPAPAPEEGKEPWELMEPTIWRVQSCNVLGSIDTINEEALKEIIEPKTHGRLKIEIYPDCGLSISLDTIISSVQDGLQELGEGIGSFVHGECYVADIGEFWGLVPYTKEAQIAGVEALRPFYEEIFPRDHNQYFLAMDFGDPMAIFTNKKVNSLDDIKGMKLRAKGPYMHKLVAALGASPVALSAPEMYEALARGVVDGVITSPCWIWDHKMYEICKYIFHVQTGFSTTLDTVNKDAMDALPAEVQQWVREAWDVGHNRVIDAEFKVVDEKTQGLIDKGMEIVYISPEDMERIRVVTEPMIEEYLEKGPPVAREMMAALKAAFAE